MAKLKAVEGFVELATEYATLTVSTEAKSVLFEAQEWRHGEAQLKVNKKQAIEFLEKALEIARAL